MPGLRCAGDAIIPNLVWTPFIREQFSKWLASALYKTLIFHNFRELRCSIREIRGLKLDIFTCVKLWRFSTTRVHLGRSLRTEQRERGNKREQEGRVGYGLERGDSERCSLLACSCGIRYWRNKKTTKTTLGLSTASQWRNHSQFSWSTHCWMSEKQIGVLP